MPNSRYRKGYRKENQLVNSNKSNGCIAFRSAGSHSPVDVCVINLKLKSIRFYQCKSEDISVKEKQRLEQSLKQLNDFFTVSFQVV